MALNLIVCLFFEEEEGSSKESIAHWCNQAQGRKAKPLQLQVAPKQMLNKAVHQYAHSVLPGLSFSQSLNLMDGWLPIFFSGDTTKAYQRNLPCLFLASRSIMGEERWGSASQDKKQSTVCKVIKAKLQFPFTFQFHMCSVGLLQLPVTARFGLC